MDKEISVIIPAAGKPQNALFPGVYDLMIPINGKPTIDYILENLLQRKVTEVIILLHENDIKTYSYLEFRKSTIDITVKKVNTKSLGETILEGKKYTKFDNILIHLGDTIYTGEMSFEKENNILLKNKKVSNPQEWCFVDKNKNFIDRPNKYTEEMLLVVGLYYLSHAEGFFEKLKKEDFYTALTLYSKDMPLYFQEIQGEYYDLGHLEEYYKSKIDFLRIRSFNSLEYDNFRGIITKKSSNTEKLSWEIEWFNSLPKDLQVFTPRLTEYQLGINAEYSLEFYGYNSLADIFLYSDYPSSYYENIVDKILGYVFYVQKNYQKTDFPMENVREIYIDKTFERIEKLLENKFLSDLYDKDIITINGKKYKNIKQIISKEFLEGFFTSHIYRPEDITIIHGDMCFSNILYDTSNGLFKFIDPRGKFGEIGVWGDVKYDLAKFRHSIHGKYEYIISDLFNIHADFDLCEFEFSYFNQSDDSLEKYFDKKLQQQGYDVGTIIFIEGLLYLTMIPLHSDSLNRQIMMYLTAVILLNDGQS